jgi:glycosyltransferase involved in cell wall biosynthesis
MKIAFCNRPNYDNPLGGDAIQMLKTKEYLEKEYKIKIDIITNPKDITNEYDIVHVFNYLTYKTSKKFISKAKKNKLKVITSPIFWDYSYAATGFLNRIMGYPDFVSEERINFQRNIAKIIGFVSPKPTGLSFLFRKCAQWMFDNSDIVLPNSCEESELLLEWIKRKKDKNKVSIVVNAAVIALNSTSDNNYTEDSFCEKYNIPHKYILQVGRIEYCKNQLNLIAALQDVPEIPIVFIGQKKDKKYFKKLQNLANNRGNVYFIEFVQHNEIEYFYQYANLHVLLSLRESPGLVNIEALVNKCPIVISDKRFIPIKTYFPHQPYIVNPFDRKKLKETILLAYKERNIGLFETDKFKWEVAAKQTFDAYKRIYKQ